MPRPEREWLSCTISSGMPELVEDAAAIGLAEEPALVAEHAGLDQDRPVEPCFKSLHVHLLCVGSWSGGGAGEQAGALEVVGERRLARAAAEPGRRARTPRRRARR